MSEATSTAAGLAIGSSGHSATGLNVVQVATVFFVAMGLEPVHLFAGMWGALASIVLFGNVPLAEPTWQARVMQTFQRLMVVIVSAVMAGYAAPIVGLIFASALTPILLLLKIDVDVGKFVVFSAFVVGAGGQVFLRSFIRRYTSLVDRGPSHQPLHAQNGK